CHRAYALYVPDVEVFMAAKTQEGSVVFVRLSVLRDRQCLPRADQAGRCPVLQSAITAAHHPGQEEVMIHGGATLAKEFRIGSAQCFQVCCQTFSGSLVLPRQHKLMRD